MLVVKLEDAWRDAIATVLGAHGFPALTDTARLGALVARLSEAYNGEGVASRELLPARLAFSFARDVPKGAASVRELVGTGTLMLPKDRPLRVLDLGAGLGATTWGVARALEAAGHVGQIDATWVDTDAAALGLGLELVKARGPTPVEVRARTITGADAPRGWFDLVLVGQVLSELDRGTPSPARAQKHAAWLRYLLQHRVDAAGSLVVVEPALRERTRHVHAVRDDVLAGARAEGEVAGIFAPCLHAGACPALASEGDWCHEDLAVDLPEWLTPIARAAGLRWQGLTFSYLVLRRDGATLASRGFPLRVISGPIVTKGKRELFLCGPPGPDGGPALRLRVQRIDRHASEANAAWETLGRGDRILLVPTPELPREAGKGVGKVGPDTRIDVAPSKEY